MEYGLSLYQLEPALHKEANKACVGTVAFSLMPGKRTRGVTSSATVVKHNRQNIPSQPEMHQRPLYGLCCKGSQRISETFGVHELVDPACFQLLLPNSMN